MNVRRAVPDAAPTMGRVMVESITAVARDVREPS
jgi:hypothetical protein